MKDPVFLVTGFGAFPGASKNPTAALMQSLTAHEDWLARRGVKLERRVLPVVYDEIAPRLESLIVETVPDVILHFGLAARRRAISIETRAQNHLTQLYPDAAGRWAEQDCVRPGGTQVQPARVPTRRLEAALRRAGIKSKLSTDAGDYVCNQTFYLSLAMAEQTERMVGFIHVPRISVPLLTRAALVLIMALRRRPQLCVKER